MSTTLTLKSVRELLDCKFFIPEYQRGYRWTRQQVKDLLDDLATYNGDIEHDMWVYFTDHEYTGEPGEYFEDTNVDSFVNNLDDWDL